MLLWLAIDVSIKYRYAPSVVWISLSLSYLGLFLRNSLARLILRTTYASLPVSLRADVIGLVRKYLIGRNIKSKQKKSQ